MLIRSLHSSKLQSLSLRCFSSATPQVLKPWDVLRQERVFTEEDVLQFSKANKFLDETWNPKFLVFVAQKNHHTKFFQLGAPENVPPGTVIDNKIYHPRNYDFYLCAHAGRIGTTRPTHYHVLLDEIGFSPDDLQDPVHSLSYVYKRSTTAISVLATICYAHLAVTQMGQFIKFEDKSDTSSSHGLQLYVLLLRPSSCCSRN